MVEGLGTKSIIARQVEEQLGINGFDNVAYDAVAAIVNDLCCVGALPLVVNAYFATGSAGWYEQPARHAGLLAGWREGCVDAGATWGGGESPTLPELIEPAELELAGSAVGVIPEGTSPILGAGLEVGDEIVLVQSAGLHANGASLARMIAGQLERGYQEPLPSGRAFGEALLDRSVIYVALVRELLHADIDVAVDGGEPPVHRRVLAEWPQFDSLALHEMNRVLRSGGRLILNVAAFDFLKGAHDCAVDVNRRYTQRQLQALLAGSGREVVRLAAELGLSAHIAGTVGEGPRRVILEPIGVTYDSEALDLAPRHERRDE